MNIVIDMDGTIIEDFEYQRTKIELVDLGIIDGKKDIIIPRPYLIDFLDFCKETFENLYICSFSSDLRVNRVVECLEIKHYFTAVFGGDSLSLTEGCGLDLKKDFYLIDDYNTNTSLIRKKLDFFGIPSKMNCGSKYHIQIEDFQGYEGDNDLLRIKKEIKKRLKTRK